ncbi:MAG: 2-amino-4-hydroxy-6-hydroxymethyldihydropteridine diphosphokinase [Planctomycetaceae bacterium]|nr:2-amino-4-hydroxy-6-hydroxymethyldihydropteridine diphosphokinase [Planctomycetaceae bacterium]
MATSLIAFGANLGNRTDSLDRAINRLSKHAQVDVTACSRPYQTKPVGGPPGQDDFLNAALHIDTTLSPQQLLKLLQDVEAELGRERVERWSQRTIDLDLLLYDALILNHDNLQIPHPHMSFRRFVLEPAAEIAGTLIHPQNGWTIQQLLDHLGSSVNYLALVGPPGCGKTNLVQRVTERLSGQPLLTPAAPDVTTIENENKLIEQRDAILAQFDTTEPGDFAISDFWLAQSGAYLAYQQDGETTDPLPVDIQKTLSEAHQPKLRILIDDAATNLEKGIQLHLRELALQPQQGPLLHLTTADPEVLLQEVEAAVHSMR